MPDRVTKLLLLIVAGLLAANLVHNLRQSPQPQGDLFISAAHAQNRDIPRPLPPTVNAVKGYSVNDLRDVIALGDGKTFVVSNSKGFMVYQVGTER